ncbi:Leukemia inhibitory factor receptor [Collichthys lucidus]|uniref:Leukemia inhibitory factor receptor n=1 Tax=Collichthys lucidus TaxID=240159 RepID=A0A4U5UUC3_COLLU|nr:Leukemia inhibitory factor receptor [Collichthys lucidus]
MPHLSISPSCSSIWLICILLTIHTHAKDALTVPQVRLSADWDTQQLTISWQGGAATTFDLMILRTELNETVFYETVNVPLNQASGQHQWTWTSVEPLECTSLSIKIRSRDGQTTSEWSNTQILQGNDLPSKETFQVYPQDRIVPVGTNTTFCCIVEEGKVFGSILYGNRVINTRRLSRRSYAATIVNQGPSTRTGTNVICYDDPKTKLSGSVVFVGYPPLPTDFACETQDLSSAVCQWNEGRDSHLYGKRETYYSVNKSPQQKRREISFNRWDGNWTLVAVNHLGQYTLTDFAELGHRVHLVAPANLTSVNRAWDTTVAWQWKFDSYSSLALECQVELTSNGQKTKRTFSGVGLRSVVLSDLHPDEDYSVQVRCGAQENFWKWGNWSKPFSFKTSTTDTSVAPINLTKIAAFKSGRVIATVIAKNNAGASQPANIPLRLTGVEPLTASRAVYVDGGFPLYWQSDANATCGYVVEWHDTSCMSDCPVEWIKVAAGNTNVSVESVPSSLALLSTRQQGSNILLTWGEIPLVNRRGFILGFNVYMSNGSQFTLLANLSDRGARNYTVKGLPEGSYKFTVKAYTVAGEGTGAPASITLEPYTDWLILEILTSLGITALFLVIVTFICYKKRKWVKKAFYPDIPEPKLPGDWSRTPGPLDVKPSSHSVVHIVERPELDSSKEMLVVIPEEDEDEEGQGIGDEPVDTDEPASLRYYNQVVDERPIRPRFPDSSASSASSLDSGTHRCDGSSEDQQPQAELSVNCGGGGGGYRPQMQPRAQSEDMGLASPEPFLEPQAAIAGGYKPQSSWHFDSPVEAGESAGRAPSLGSPTSVASTEFLLPGGEEHAEEKQQLSSSAATWFTNLLSSTKP